MDYWRKVKIDTFTGLLTNEFCPGSSQDLWFFVLPEDQAVREQQGWGLGLDPKQSFMGPMRSLAEKL